MRSPNKLTVALTALTLIVALAALVVAAGPPSAGSQTSTEIPGLVSYQGYLTDTDGSPMEGPVDLTFGLYPTKNGDGTIWSETQTDVPVTAGYFHVLLGSVNPLSAGDFSDPERYLQVSVNDGSGLIDLPRQRLASVPYAMQAAGAPWAGLSGVPPGFADDIDGVEYDNVIVVAKSGGDFTSIQAAIDSVSSPNRDNRYLVWVAPGQYDERVSLKPHIDLQGAGQQTTVIAHAGSSADEPFGAATLTLSNNVSVRHLGATTRGTGAHNTALLAPAGTSGTTVSNVHVAAWGTGTANYGIVVTGTDTYLDLEQVTAWVSNGSDTNVGLLNTGGANVTSSDSAFSAIGGDRAYAVINRDDGSELRAHNLSAVANGASVDNVGLWNEDDARANLNGGSFSGRDGVGMACGICNDDASVSAVGVDVDGSGNSIVNYGLRNDGGMAGVQGGDYHAGADEGGDAYGISNNSGVSAFAPSLTVHDANLNVGGPDTNRCYALYNQAGGNALVAGGQLWAAVCGGPQYGAYNTGSGSTLEVNSALIKANAIGPPFGLFAGEGTTTNVSQCELQADTALETEGGSGHLQFVHLDGDVAGDTSHLVCNAVTQGGTFYANDCPAGGP